MALERSDRRISCSVCGDWLSLLGTGAYFARDTAWFRSRHPDEPHGKPEKAPLPSGR